MARLLRWLVCGTLLLAAGTLTLVAAQRHWAVCRPDPSSAGCLLREEVSLAAPVWASAGHRDPTTAVLTVIACFLLFLAWVLAVGWARRRLIRTLVTLVVAAQPLLAAVLGIVDLVTPDAALRLATSGWLTWPAEMLVLPMLLGAGWIFEEGALAMVRLVVLGWTVTAFGSIHGFFDYVIFMIRHPVPPGTPVGTVGAPAGMGFGAAIVQLALGVVVIGLSVWADRPRRPDTDRRGRDGFTLAA
ncbi:hypothetical protein FHX74_001810 [Friedmanniella endophytica]|uniref:Uncharacterized protein n=1 Tax=Microlunatus kandeliicorticis TaxID=1759536 RepID=A0A7W3P5T6_9ACTN|nr:hypothetical protein [Microlunatus kandeliicorticis]MBA8794205.1 hypothetical protein [Microlunatus kandeliicorticis]